MKFAIIAAGDGSRLAQEGVTEPKPLVKVRGERLIDRLIRIFMGNNATEIVVICNEQMSDVASHLKMIQDEGLNGLHVPLRFVIKSTPSSMHSFYELRHFLRDEPFVLTTVDTIFDESEFHDYVLSFQDKIAQGTNALMGVTDYIDDEKPLYVGVDKVMRINGYYDTPQANSRFISAGMYGLTDPSLDILEACIEKGESRMRNFQRALVAANLRIEAFPLTKVFDIDHIEDIRKADEGVKNLSSSCKGKALLIQRAACYSPNSEEKDLAILQEVGCFFDDVNIVGEGEFVENFSTYNQLISAESVGAVNAYYQIISMARSPKALDCLEQLEQRGIRVLNPSVGIRACQRSNVEKVMRENHLPLPPDKGDDGYWVKRADAAAQSKEDVCFCHDWAEVEKIKSTFMQRGITDIVTQAHVKGDVVKFYGVEGTDFFRYYYSGDDTETKFGDEERNGKPQYYPFSSSDLQTDAEKLACLLQTPIYGGDAIIQEDGSYVIIDFNDFPSFSKCRKEAAKAIFERVKLAVECSSKTSFNEKCKDDMSSCS
ncbi:nucleotidyltransferase family protein [Prevotella melaninogenica]|uniref:nucleotidyltransferase family protein n=1 Tax=Prevotella melaninogenica TaxID=28132 RepID=UPI001BA8E03D|nr:sugar phosphate nucleotidyltransferase [Prevotella melaninogenica]QUB66446.1 NTP transferase domain-containing protein [Prevotella melaninogenica]